MKLTKNAKTAKAAEPVVFALLAIFALNVVTAS
jgi:hypothetical protein